ncbi:MAG: hypothetical protein Q4D76_16430 [Oscillospiraceae bacterium]|nr:hypothetical protein [Oscillospiraceae bacterium]
MKEIESIKDKIKDLEEVVCEQKKIAVYFADECSEKDRKIEALEKQIEGYNKYDNLLSSLDEKLRKAGEIANDADKKIAEANKEKDKAIELAHKSEKAKQIAEEEKVKAEREKEAAVLKQKLAERTANNAILAQKRAEEGKNAAVTAKLKAENDKSIAISEMQNAVNKMKNAISEKINAENEKKNALLLQQKAEEEKREAIVQKQKAEKEKEDTINEKNHLEEQLHNATQYSYEQIKGLVDKLGTGDKCNLLRNMYEKYSHKSNPSALFNDFEYTIRDIIGTEENFSNNKWSEFINIVNIYRRNNSPNSNAGNAGDSNIPDSNQSSGKEDEELRNKLTAEMDKLSKEQYISVLKYTFQNKIDDDTARDLMDALDKKINNGRND